MAAEFEDDDLKQFVVHGAAPLPLANRSGYIDNQGARIWYSTHGNGPTVILLHGGLGHSGNWAHQVPALVARGYSTLLIDSRGHGRSTRDSQPYSYELLASDVLAVMDALGIKQAAFAGWSDGACTALILATTAPSRAAGVFFFACNMDPSGTKPFEATPTIDRCFNRHKKDYAERSTTPDQFDSLVEDLGLMQRTQPNYTVSDLASIRVPVTIVQSEHDEFIRREHAEHLAKNISGAKYVLLKGVTHFAPLQRPDQFNEVLLGFLDNLKPTGI